MSHAIELQAMHATWLVDSVLTPERFDSESVSFLQAALSPEVRSVSAHRITTWLDVIEAIEAQSSPTGDDDSIIALGPRAASNFLTHQRRRRSNLCRYQTERLELLPGFSWAPLDAAFVRRLAELQAYMNEHGRRPRLKSDDTAERSLARWVRHMRDRDNQGQLSETASAALRELSRTTDP